MPARAAQTTRIVEAPLYIAADLHSNIAHLMLDSVWPAIANLARLHHAAASGEQSGASRFAASLPDTTTGSFAFLLTDSPGAPDYWHRGKKERKWTAQLSGGGVTDLTELAAACPPPGVSRAP